MPLFSVTTCGGGSSSGGSIITITQPGSQEGRQAGRHLPMNAFSNIPKKHGARRRRPADAI